jgi:UDP-glucose 4-epimerase
MEQVNHWGTAHLAEACLATGVRHLIFLSSTAVYGPGGPYTEADVCRPQGAYAQSKLAAEIGLESARRRGLNVTVLRIGTLFGLAPVTRFDAVANRFAFLAGVGRPVTVHGDGAQRRPLLHVRDASAAVRHFVQSPGSSDATLFNVVGATVSIGNLIELLRRLRPDLTVRHTEQDIRTHLSFDIVGARLHETGWLPHVAVPTGLNELLSQFRRITPMAMPVVEDES